MLKPIKVQCEGNFMNKPLFLKTQGYEYKCRIVHTETLRMLYILSSLLPNLNAKIWLVIKSTKGSRDF